MEPVSCLTDVAALWCYSTLCPCPVCRFAWMVFNHFAHEHHSKIINFFVCNYNSLVRSFGSQLFSEFSQVCCQSYYMFVTYIRVVFQPHSWGGVLFALHPKTIFLREQFCTLPIFQNCFYTIPHFFCHLGALLSENMWWFHCILCQHSEQLHSCSQKRFIYFLLFYNRIWWVFMYAFGLDTFCEFL